MSLLMFGMCTKHMANVHANLYTFLSSSSESSSHSCWGPPRCHNPIFTPGIFSGVGTQNGTARTRLDRPKRDLSTPAEKSSIFNLNSFYLFLFRFLFFLDTDPHLASVVCDLYLFPFRDTSCVCVWELVYVCACEHKFGVATNHGKF